MEGIPRDVGATLQWMPIESTGNVDVDYLMMVPHRQSAIEMACVQGEQGQGEEIKAMAQAIIDPQEKGTADMCAMLERMVVETAAAPAQ